MNIRESLATHIGLLTISGMEALATVKAHEERVRTLEGENARLLAENKDLKATQSAGKVEAVAHLANGHDAAAAPSAEG